MKSQPELVEALYLDLLKKSLTDYLHVDDPIANAMPVDLAMPKGRRKEWRNRTIVKLLARLNMFAVKGDGRSPEDRRAMRERGLDWPPRAVTMVGLKRLDNLQNCIETVIAENVPGDLLEAGAWRGGASILMRAVLKIHAETARTVWVCDSFAGLPSPDASQYPADAGDRHNTFPFLVATEKEVRDNFAAYGMLDDQVRIVKGLFKDTLPSLPVQSLAVLRIDGDMYESTWNALEALYDKVPAGGFVIVDDYGLAPCAQAVDEFRASRSIAPALRQIDDTGVFWRV